MTGTKMAKAPLREQKGLSGAITDSNCEGSMPRKTVTVNIQEATSEHDAYGKSNGGQSGQLTA